MSEEVSEEYRKAGRVDAHGVTYNKARDNGEPAHLKSPLAMGRPTSRGKLGTINKKE